MDCYSDKAWSHGSSLINYMKFGDFVGLSGNIKFDTYGRRTNLYLDVLELQATGLEPIGRLSLNIQLPKSISWLDVLVFTVFSF